MEDYSVFSILKSFYIKLKEKRKKQVFFLLIIVIASALAETLSLASAFPFLQAIINSDNLWTNSFVSSGLLSFGFDENDNLILPISILFGATAFLASSLKIYNLWFSGRLAAFIGSDLSNECFKQNIFQSYEKYFSNKSSNLITNNTLYISQCTEILASAARLFSNVLIGLCLSIYLIILDPLLAIFSIIIFLLVYILLGKKIRRKLIINSKIIDKNSRYQVQLMQEVAGSFRDIILSNNQNYFIRIYKNIDKKIRLKNAENVFYNVMPRYAIEGLFLILFTLIVYTVSFYESTFSNIISVLGTFALGAQKLLPCMQQSYGTWSFIVGSKSSLVNVIKLSNQTLDKSTSLYNPKPFLFKKSINFINLFYKYPTSNKFTLKDTNVQILKGERVGIIGETGAGKTTFIDLFMGLIEPSNGFIEVDGVNISERDNFQKKLDWRKSIAHVPQNIFLNDATIAENIAFGESLDELDMKRVVSSAKKANIDKFISEKPCNYLTNIGENGVQLSGGQRQRIGIARALYKALNIIVLDEATSALDFSTETNIMNSIYALNKNTTVIVITHRENSIKKCDKVFEIIDGNIKLRQNF